MCWWMGGTELPPLVVVIVAIDVMLDIGTSDEVAGHNDEAVILLDSIGSEKDTSIRISRFF